MLGKKVRIEIVDGNRELTINKILAEHDGKVIDIKLVPAKESFKFVVIYEE